MDRCLYGRPSGLVVAHRTVDRTVFSSVQSSPVQKLLSHVRKILKPLREAHEPQSAPFAIAHRNVPFSQRLRLVGQSRGRTPGMATQSLSKRGAGGFSDRQGSASPQRSASTLARTLGVDASHRQVSRGDCVGHALFARARHGAFNPIRKTSVLPSLSSSHSRS